MSLKAFAQKWLILLHRWLGIGFCLLFIVWFASGIVMMYARMPRLTNEERLIRLENLDFRAAKLSPNEAFAKLNETEIPTTVRLGMFNGRPIYRFQIKQLWKTVFADSGEVLNAISADNSVIIAKSFYPEHAEKIAFLQTLEDADQWTLSSAIRRLKPLHQLALNDEAGSQIYVSSQTGEVVLKTDSRGRFWGYVGAVLHWIYFTPLKKHSEVWNWTIVIISFIGSLMCLMGIVIGLWRFSMSKRFQRKTSHTPYRGDKRLHHWLGMIFGLFTFTWILSGMFSMNPFDWSPSKSPSKEHLEVVRGGKFDLAKFQVPPLKAQQIYADSFKIKELELSQFRGKPYYFAVETPQVLVDTNWSNTDFAGYLASETKMRQMFLNAETGETLTEFAPETFEKIAVEAMPNAKIIEQTWLKEYDNYYYAQKNDGKNLPVLRVKYDDEKSTWLYFDPQLGKIALKHESLSRVERWLYQGLHSLDFPMFYQSRPLWDIILILLSSGGIWLSWTAVKLSWVRVKGRKS